MNDNMRIIQLLEAPKGVFSVIKKESGYYEAYPVFLFALYADGTLGKIILSDNEFCKADTIDGYMGCYTEKKMKEHFPSSFLILP